MAALNRWSAAVAATVVAACAAAWVVGCGKLVGLGGPVTPLARIEVQIEGDVAPFVPSWAEDRKPQLRVALVWGAQWQPEPICIIPPATDAVDAVLKAGCPDSFGFVPARVGADVPVGADGAATFELLDLPAADVMVGGITARIAYASFMVYDDHNGNGTLDLFENHFFDEDDEQGNEAPAADAGDARGGDIVYGASFISMTLPDKRLAFREGGFDEEIAFYPRSGCPAPPKGYSVLSTGGFSQADGFSAAAQGRLPVEDPAACGEASPDATVITIPVQPPEPIKQLACQTEHHDRTRYRSPPADSPDLAHQTWACAPLPELPDDDAGAAEAGASSSQDVTQLIIAALPYAACRRLTHYLLKGCRHDPKCLSPDWDLSANPPPWWPCPVSP